MLDTGLRRTGAGRSSGGGGGGCLPAAPSLRAGPHQFRVRRRPGRACRVGPEWGGPLPAPLSAFRIPNLPLQPPWGARSPGHASASAAAGAGRERRCRSPRSPGAPGPPHQPPAPSPHPVRSSASLGHPASRPPRRAPYLAMAAAPRAHWPGAGGVGGGPGPGRGGEGRWRRPGAGGGGR